MDIERFTTHICSHLFTVRVWEEEMGNGQCEWRGKVQLLTGGEVRYFCGWAALAPLLMELLSNVVSLQQRDEGSDEGVSPLL